MALSGTLSTKDIGPEIADNRYYQLDWTATQDIVNNKSTINWTLKMVAGDPAHAGWIAERTLKVVIAGQTVVDKVDRVERMPDGTVFASGTIPLDHNSDGTKSFTASIQAALYYSEVNTTASKTFTLNTIARHTTMSVANGTLGTAQTLTLTRQSTSYKHTIKATCGSYSAYIQGATGTLGSTATKLTATSITFTPPMDLASLNTTGTSLSVTWTVETFNDTTSIGTKSYTKTYAIPASIKPSASLTLSDANGYASDWGGSYIQNKSKFSGNVTAAGSYGSTIKSYSTVVNGKTYTGSSFTTDVISGSGNYTITTTVTDSRGRTASATQTATVIPYTDPTISIKEVYRSNASGVATASGEYLTVKFDATVASMDTSNCAMYEVSYKKPTDTSYITVALGNYDDWFTVTDGTYTFLADASSSYNVVVSVEDSFSTTETFGTGKSKSKLWSLLSGGLGIAIGKVADWAGFEVDMPARFNQETLVYSEPDDCYYDLGNE